MEEHAVVRQANKTIERHFVNTLYLLNIPWYDYSGPICQQNANPAHMRN